MEQAKQPHKQNTHGFTLVELSIVLVILGLLTGGVLAGQSLIRAAELRSITTEFTNFRTATYAFRNKYFAKPGDITNAESFWGTFSAGGGCPAGTGVGTETCNGDGNGSVEFGAASEASEIHTFWQHLSNAGLIEGTYTGITGPGGIWDGELGINLPESKVSSAGWSTADFTWAANSVFSDFAYRDVFMFGTIVGTDDTYGKILTPEEAWNIDTKMDDGMPQQGKVWAAHWDDCTDAGTSAIRTGEYLLADDTVQCSLIFHSNY